MTRLRPNQARRRAEKSDVISQPGALRLKEWHHLAVAFDGSGTRLYLDGALVGSAPYTGGLATVSGPDRHFVGACSLFPNNSFHGQLKEVRLWRGVRSAGADPREPHEELTGTEPGLVGLWNFADPANPGPRCVAEWPSRPVENRRAGCAQRAPTIAAQPCKVRRRFTGPTTACWNSMAKAATWNCRRTSFEDWRKRPSRAGCGVMSSGPGRAYFTFGEGDYRLDLMNGADRDDQWAAIDYREERCWRSEVLAVASPPLTAGQWAHVAVVRRQGRDELLCRWRARRKGSRKPGSLC